MPQLSIMLKPASSLCNMRCKYCFYHSLAETRENFGFGVMQKSTVDYLIQKALKFADGESIYWAFQGGEPLLAGIEYFENFVTVVDKYNVKNSLIHYSMQTNGTLIDDKWAKFLHDNKFLVGVSLDGDVRANKFRLDSSLNGVFNTTMLAKKY